MSSLRNEWSNAFQGVKSRDFSLDPEQVIGQIVKRTDRAGLDQYTEKIVKQLEESLTGKMQVIGGGGSIALPNAMWGYAVPKGQTTGRISGADLLQAKNDFRMEINSRAGAEGATAVELEAMRRAADEIDAAIERQLTPDELSEYLLEKRGWGNYRALKDSVGRARNRGSDFDDSDWINSMYKANPRQVEERTGTLVSEANALKAAREDIKAKAEETITNTALTRSRTKEQIDDAKTVERRRVTRERDALRDSLKLRDNPEIAVDGVVERAKNTRKELNKLGPATPSIFSTKAASFTLPALAGMSFGPAAATAAVTAGPLLSAKSTQRALAGQTGVQKYISNLLRKYNAGKMPQGMEALASSSRRAAIDDENQGE